MSQVTSKLSLLLASCSKHLKVGRLNFSVYRAIASNCHHSSSSNRSKSQQREHGPHQDGSSSTYYTKATFLLSGLALAGFTLNAAEELQEKRKSHLHPLDKGEENRIIREADVLYSQDQPDNLLDFLRRYSNVSSAEINWRLARAACDKGKHCEIKSSERKDYMFEAFEHAKRSVELDDKCGACHRWYGIMLNYVGDYEGNKEKIKQSYIVRDHFKRAVELDPKDATSMYCLGTWCFFFADMSWYTKKIAAIAFATPPSSTFEEALKYFLMAEEADPNFFSMNHVMLAKTYLKLNDKAKAKEHLVKARDLPVRSPDDKEAHAEAIQLLNECNK